MFLLRHGQSYFNLYFSELRIDPGIEDPELTPLGHEQAALAAVKLAGAGITRVIISPYTRALETAEPFLHLCSDVAVEVMQEVRERAAFACDIGSHPEVLAARFPRHVFTHLPEKWWLDGLESSQETMARAGVFRDLMAEREDSATTLLVGHWAFILALTGEQLGNGEIMEYDPRNAAPELIDWYPL